MKKVFIAIMALSPLFTLAQSDPPYTMVESIMLTPDNAHLKEFSENLKAHNEKFHKSGLYAASVWSIATGPNVGKIVWMMGPLTFSDLDNRPSGSDHDEDWSGKVLPYVKKVTNGEYWKRDDKVSNIVGENRPIVRVRYLEVAKGQGYRVNGLFEQISKAVKAMDGEHPWSVYSNQFRQGYKIGRHIAAVTGFKNWAELDSDDNFIENFEKVNGEGSYQRFTTAASEVFSNSEDEFWTFMPNLSPSQE
jgi:hypothetical protein